MTTQKIMLPVLKYDEFSGRTAKIICRVRMSDLRKISLPLNANVRKPSRNYVVNSILTSIKTKNGSMVMDAPVFVVCRSVRPMAAADRSDMYYVEIGFGDMDGVLDGGHRLEAARIANIDRAEYDTDNVFLTFNIEAGLSLEEVRSKAIALNTSKNPAAYEMAHMRGDLDWFKEITAETEFTHIEYYSNQLEGGFKGDPSCRAILLATLNLVVSPQYNPHALGALPRDRHPINMARTNGIGGNAPINELVRKNRDRFGSYPQRKFLVDLLSVYCLIFEQLDIRHSQSSLPLVKSVKSSTRATHLPTGKVLVYKHPARLYVLPILSCFRLLVNDQGDGWKIDPTQDLKSTKALIDRLITEYRAVLQLGDRLYKNTAMLAADIIIWDKLYNRAEKFIRNGEGFKGSQGLLDIAA